MADANADEETRLDNEKRMPLLETVPHWSICWGFRAGMASLCYTTNGCFSHSTRPHSGENWYADTRVLT